MNNPLRRAEHNQGVEDRNVAWQTYMSIAAMSAGGCAGSPPGRGGTFGRHGISAQPWALADLDAELEQFPVDAGRAPQRLALLSPAVNRGISIPGLGRLRSDRAP